MTKFLTPGELCELEIGSVKYQIAAPSVADKVAYERAIAANGARFWSEPDRLTALRDGVIEIMPDDSADRAAILAIVDAAIESLKTAIEMWRSSGGDTDGDIVRGWTESIASTQRISDTVMRGSPRYADIIADNSVYRSLRGIAAARLFVKEWNDTDNPLIMAGKALSDASIEMINYDHFPAIGVFVDNLMRPSEPEIKNSKSRQRGGAAAKTSASRKTPRHKDP